MEIESTKSQLFKFPTKQVVDQLDPCLYFVVPKGSIEDQLKHWANHINGSRNMAGYKGICSVAGRCKAPEGGRSIGARDEVSVELSAS